MSKEIEVVEAVEEEKIIIKEMFFEYEGFQFSYNQSYISELCVYKQKIQVKLRDERDARQEKLFLIFGAAKPAEYGYENKSEIMKICKKYAGEWVALRVKEESPEEPGGGKTEEDDIPF